MLSMLEAVSRRRRLVQSDQTVDAKAAFLSVIQEWRGPCSGKHYLLDRIFKEEEMESTVIMPTHRFTAETTANYPAELPEVVARGQAPDVHTCIRLNTAAGWMTVTPPCRPRQLCWAWL